MAQSANTLARTKDTVDTLLRQLGLAAYLFEVEPARERWQVRIECATDTGWQSLSIEVDATELAAVATDEATRVALLERWRARLSACKRT